MARKKTETIRPAIGTRVNVKKSGGNAWRKWTTQYQAFVPPGFSGGVKSAVDILRRARAACEIEGAWMQGEWYHNEHPEVDPEDAFCNNWEACADGFILMVSTGVQRTVYEEYGEHRTTLWTRTDGPERGKSLYKKIGQARKWMALAALDTNHATKNRFWYLNEARLDAEGGGPAQEIITVTNDTFCDSRTKALEWFDKAIELAETRGKGRKKVDK